MKKIAVILSGCGHLDGSEITESVSTLIALSQLQTLTQVFAPSVDLAAVNHLKGQPQGQKRNVLEESARIARGEIKDLSELRVEEFDALVFPGGYGAAKNLSDWAEKGSQAKVHQDVQRAILGFHQAGKPIGAICIAPTLIACTLGAEGVTLTIGNDKETAQEILKTGAHHENCRVDDFITDRAHKVVTTPAYMYGEARPSEVFKGISLAMKELVEMA
jgi:enhancing lycopene biosynthesis protein 2